MPTAAHKNNRWKVGDVVSMVHFNGAGEGVLWQVKKVSGVYVTIEAIMTLTGPSVLRRKTVSYHQVDAPDLVQLASVYARLGTLIADIARSRQG